MSSEPATDTATDTATSATAATAPPSTRNANLLGAILWMLGALVSFSLIAIAGREASRVVTTTELMFWRSTIGVTVLLIILYATGGRLRDLTTRQPLLQVGRSIIHFGAQFSWLYCLTLISLAELFALEFTAPLWVAVLAPFFLGERLTAVRIAAAVIGFVGALIVIRPGSASLSYGSLLALASAVGFAVNLMATKKLTRTDPPFTILFWMNVLQAIIGTGFLLRGITWPGPITWVAIVAVALLGLTAHYSLSRAFKLADAIIVAPMDFLRLPLIAVVGAVLYGETLSPAVLIGALFIIAANALNVLGERKGPQRR